LRERERDQIAIRRKEDIDGEREREPERRILKRYSTAKNRDRVTGSNKTQESCHSQREGQTE